MTPEPGISAPEGIRQIEATIWEHERSRFDRVMIQNGDQAPIAVSYQELEATLGPRAPGLGEVPLADLAGMFAGGLGGGSGAEFTYFSDLFKVVATAVGVAVFVAVLALGFGSVARSQRRAPDHTEERLFS